MRFFCVLLLHLAFVCETFAQDILQKFNKSKIEVKIIEIGTDEIKYKNFNDLDGPIYVISKRDVMSIQRENGEVIEFEKDILEVSESPASHKRKAIMVDPFSPLVRHLCLGYQQWINPNIILEGKIGIIGIGVNNRENFNGFDDKKRGAFLTVGNKMMFKQLTYTKGTRIVHPLAGAYFRPQISFSYFQNREIVYDFSNFSASYTPISYVATFNNFSGAFNLTIGKQFLIADVVLLDIFAGTGYGFATRNTKSYLPTNNYLENTNPAYFHSHSFLNSWDFPLTFTSGISLGILLK